LYVADTENHILRQLDLDARTVTTIAGTGAQARAVNVLGTGTGVALNSPWDLQVIGTQLFIAMAGPHQIWVMHLETGQLEPYAGSGREDIIDGPRLEAAMAQPSGITSDGMHLFVADSETSAIRSITFGDDQVRTVVGEGLFEFGDRDGTGVSEVRLQHPLGIDADNGMLYVADTYNHKIKRIDPDTGTSVTYLGTGRPGQADGKTPEFYEPGGVSVAGGKLYIADTNNHAIRVADLSTRDVSTLRRRGLAMPAAVAGFSDTSFGSVDKIEVQPLQVRAGQAGQLGVYIELPEGYHLNPRAPFAYRVDVTGNGITVAEAHRRFRAIAPPLPLRIPFEATPGEHQAMLDVDLTFSFCREDDTGVCAIQSVRWNVPLQTVDKEVKTEPSISYQAASPKVNKQL
jgi:DNA-binding beta-propeller fold protein YncE